MQFETVVLTIENKIAKVLLNRPEVLNAMNPKMSNELGEVFRLLAKMNDVRVIIIMGAGRAFCSGGDLKVQKSEIAKNDALARAENNIRPMNEAILSLTNLKKPVIAAVNGPAIGAGMSLALACDIRIASSEAKFGMVFVKTGLHSDTGATYFLPRIVGAARASELLFTGDIIDAKAAGSIGLVNSVVDKENFEEHVFKLANKIARQAPIPIAGIKLLIQQSMNMDLRSMMEFETSNQIVCVQSADHREGLKAFYEKREPQFEGK